MAFPPLPSPRDDTFPPCNHNLIPSPDSKTQRNESSTTWDYRVFLTVPDELQIQGKLQPCTFDTRINTVLKLLPETSPALADLSRLAFSKEMDVLLIVFMIIHV